VELDTFVVMPNHVHGIIVLTEPAGAGLKPAPTKKPPLSEIIRAFKTFSSRRINALRDMPGISTWQRNYYEHVIRDEDVLSRVREYIATNPLRWELDRENPQRTGKDEFDRWLATFKTQPDRML
jgi:REP element-mobilizing transposase RayT